MPRRNVRLPRALQRKLGVELFNRTWRLLAKKKRTPREREEMLHAAHASRYHWGQVGTARNLSIGEWQISRVYTVLGRAEPALHHARRSLAISRKARLDAFYVGYAYEALARASALDHERAARNRYLRQAVQASKSIRDPADRRLLLSDLRTIR